MTVVVAKKFGELILVASDTEITNKGATKRDVIPGALKSIVIDLNCSIALSGNYIRGLDLVQSLRKTYLRTRDFDQLLELLRRDSKDGECDYIVSMHRPYAELRKIWEGHLSEPIDTAWLGHSKVATLLLNVEPSTAPNDPCLGTTEDQLTFYRYQSALQTLNLNKGVFLGADVGGVLIMQMGSPYGHTYGGYACTTYWDMKLDPALRVDNGRARATGEISFGYSVYAPVERGAPLLGIYYEQAQVAAIYSPLAEDKPKLVRSTRAEMVERVNALVKRLGAVCTKDWTAPGQDFDAIANTISGKPDAD